ncbi:MAG TPA: hypothetical protein VNT99_10630 [Methylomirabilota bacterium]|nr:hypothetical protein [Methylomirabilota bacterium]
MKWHGIAIGALVLITMGLTLNQWRLQQRLEQQLSAGRMSAALTDTADGVSADAKLREAEQRLNEARIRYDLAEQKLASANARLAALTQRSGQLESGRPRLVFTEDTGLRPVEQTQVLEGGVSNVIKRSWGPEQAAGEPDTFQAGDISTAWAPLEQDGGEEWLKLDYEHAVDIAEVRVRETYNPGAISKVTAFLANGTEVVLWEGVEPPSQAPVEMSFQVPSNVNAQSVKVYLDTTRVPGWNEIDAVQLIGRDGSKQWARHVSVSSTYAQARTARGLERF